MADRPFLTSDEVAALGGVDPKTVTRYLLRSRPGGKYAADPFPAPDGHHGRARWWHAWREREIRLWFERRRLEKGRGAGRPRKST